MATADPIRTLSRSHREGDDRIYPIAMRVAAPSAHARPAQGDEA